MLDDLSIRTKMKIPIPERMTMPNIHHRRVDDVSVVSESCNSGEVRGISEGLGDGEISFSSTRESTLPLRVGDGLIVAFGVGVGLTEEVNESVLPHSLEVELPSLSLQVTLYVPALV